MYGTVMIGQAADGVGVDDYRKMSEEWAAAHQGIGFVDEWAMQADDGRLVVAVRFSDKDSYMKLADDPAQDEWYTNVLRPLLTADPEWIDGEWLYDSAG